MTQDTISGLRRLCAALRPCHALATVLTLGLNAAVMLAQSPAPVTIGAAIEAATKDYPGVTEATARA